MQQKSQLLNISCLFDRFLTTKKFQVTFFLICETLRHFARLTHSDKTLQTKLL